MDGVPATLDVLTAIVDAVNDTSFPVFLDGGIRAGTDVFKAIALGEWDLTVTILLDRKLTVRTEEL